MKKVCLHCGLPEEEHHEFEAAMPDGCVCPPGEWSDDVAEVCGAHEGDGEQCTRCEHDRACHGAAA